MSRHLYLVSSEFRPLARKTGLAGFYGLGRALLEMGCWGQEVSLVMPYYEGMDLTLEGPATADGCRSAEARINGLRYVIFGRPEWGGAVNDRGRITTPHSNDAWEPYARCVVEWIRQEVAETCELDVLAVDWPTGPVVAGIRQDESLQGRCRNLAFTVDLPPADECAATRECWLQGLQHAGRLHLPTTRWWERLRRTEPDVAGLSAPHVETICFGIDPQRYSPAEPSGLLGDSTFRDSDPAEAITKARGQAKVAFQKLVGLEPNREAVLVIASHRRSSDDQKNYRAVAAVAQRLLDIDPRVQLLAAPYGGRALGKSTWAMEELQRLADVNPGRLVYRQEGDPPAGLDWTDQLRAADIQLIPSRYEPCGLNHAQGMFFGVVPVLSQAGCMGDEPMKDWRKDAAEGNGFRFHWDDGQPGTSLEEFASAAEGCIRLCLGDRAGWETIRSNTMRAAKAYSWDVLAPKYVERLFP